MSVTFALLFFFSFFLDKIFEGESPSARVQRWIVDLSKYIFVSDLRWGGAAAEGAECEQNQGAAAQPRPGHRHGDQRHLHQQGEPRRSIAHQVTK